MSDQKVNIDLCPILRPNDKQFENFYQYIQRMEAKYKDQYGMVKIIPPKNWICHDQTYQHLKSQMKVKKPIEQHAKMSKNDYYQIRNIIQQSMDLKRFEKKVADKSATEQSSHEKTQEKFWKTIKYTPPVYGADLHKSLMSPIAGSWNLGKLDSLLSDAAPVLIKGVTYPYCYVGTWKSIFCWHKEDLDLAAINYLHEGKQKYWYCIQTEHQNILQDEAKQAFPQNYLSCKHFMRHKTTLINPYKLKQRNPNLKISKAYQGPNQFMVAFSGSYHCGFNSGKNMAEAVNFATRDWLKKLVGVTYCVCTQRSVRPDFKFFIDNLQREQSRFREDPYLKHLKSWVIKNDLLIDNTIDDEPKEAKAAQNTTFKQQNDESLSVKKQKIKIIKKPQKKEKKKVGKKVERKVEQQPRLKSKLKPKLKIKIQQKAQLLKNE